MALNDGTGICGTKTAVFMGVYAHFRAAVFGPWFTAGHPRATQRCLPLSGPFTGLLLIGTSYEPQLIFRDQSAPKQALQRQFSALDAHGRTVGASRNPSQDR
jgi:hypothetical protein